MKFIFLYAFLMSSGDIAYAAQESLINWRPIKSIEVCKNEAKKIEARLNNSLKHGNHLFESVMVTCQRQKLYRKR